MSTTELVTAATIVGGLGGAIWAMFKGMALWRAGTSGRQQNLMARLERENARAYHDRDQYELRYNAAVDHIRAVERAHRNCPIDVPPFRVPRWRQYRGEREREQQEGPHLVENPDDAA